MTQFGHIINILAYGSVTKKMLLTLYCNIEVTIAVEQDGFTQSIKHAF